MTDAWFVTLSACSILGLLTLFTVWACGDRTPRRGRRRRWEC